MQSSSNTAVLASAGLIFGTITGYSLLNTENLANSALFITGGGALRATFKIKCIDPVNQQLSHRLKPKTEKSFQEKANYYDKIRQFHFVYNVGVIIGSGLSSISLLSSVMNIILLSAVFFATEKATEYSITYKDKFC